MDVKSVVKILTKRGLKVEEDTSVKNGIRLPVVRLVTGTNTCPIVYLEGYDDLSLEEACNLIERTFDEAMKVYPELSAEEIPDIFYIENIRAGVRKAGGEDNIGAITKDFLDLEIYLYALHKMGTVTISEGIKEQTPLKDYTNDELFDIALKNSFKEIRVSNLPFEGMILTNVNNFKGAVEILDTEAISKIAEFYESDLWIIPSSLHEIMVVRAVEEAKDEMQEMIINVNKTLGPIDKLSDSLYFFSLKDGSVSIVK